MKLKKHDNEQTNDLPKIEFLHNFHKFYISYRKRTFEKFQCSKVSKSNLKKKKNGRTKGFGQHIHFKFSFEIHSIVT